MYVRDLEAGKYVIFMVVKNSIPYDGGDIYYNISFIKHSVYQDSIIIV